MKDWDKYVIDATMGVRDGMFAFCPIEGDMSGDFTVVTGYTFMGDDPPEGAVVVAVVHEDGQEAVERFFEENADELEALKNRIVARGD